jgi:hypothetical protein
MDLVNNYIYILEIPINIISKLRSLLRKNIEKKRGQKKLSLFLVLLLKSHNT